MQNFAYLLIGWSFKYLQMQDFSSLTPHDLDVVWKYLDYLKTFNWFNSIWNLKFDDVD